MEATGYLNTMTQILRFSFAWTMNGCYVPINNCNMLKAQDRQRHPSFCCSFPLTSSKCGNSRAANTLPQACSVLPSACVAEWHQIDDRAAKGFTRQRHALLPPNVWWSGWVKKSRMLSDWGQQQLGQMRFLIESCLHVLCSRGEPSSCMLFFGLHRMYFPNNSRDCGIYLNDHTNIDPSGFRGRPLHSHYDLCVPISPLGYTGRGCVQFCLDQTPCWDTFAPASWTTAQNPKSGEGFSLVLGPVLPSIPVDTLWCLTHTGDPHSWCKYHLYILPIYIYIFIKT